MCLPGRPSQAFDAGQCSRAKRVHPHQEGAESDTHLQPVGVRAAHHLAHQLTAATAPEAPGLCGQPAAQRYVSQWLHGLGCSLGRACDKAESI